MAPLAALVNPAGGLRYHWRALRHRRRLWAGFTGPLAGWLAAWEPAPRALVLVGPSAGYCLPEAFLARFAAIHLLEPDPLARWLFARRFPGLGARLASRATDYFRPAAGVFPPPAALVRDFPDEAILFCNLLGQLHVLHPAAAEGPAFAAWKADLDGVLAGRAWASFHDRLSGPLAPRPADPGEPVAPPYTDAALVRRFYAPGPSEPVELVDHGTADLFPGRARRYFAWEITPGYFHLIEAVRSPA